MTQDCKKNKLNKKVLIVSSDNNITKLLLQTFAKKGVFALVSKNAQQVPALVEKHNFNLILDVTSLVDQDNLDLLKVCKKSAPETAIIKITQTSDFNNSELVQFAVNAIKTGYCDFITKDINPQMIENLLETYLPNHQVEMSPIDQDCSAIVGKSPKLKQTIELVKKLAPTDAPVLISGESGTGKELIANLIHKKSSRENGPYIRVNCAALNDGLAESELFGHEKGAFTGAHIQRKGRFELAHGGTLLLDEITETPIKFQAKLLRALEQQDFERVGGNTNISVNVRVLSTTNKNIPLLIQQGKFRQDLYYRLCGIRLILPALRERKEDIEELTWHFVNLYAPQSKRRITKLDPEMIEIFKSCHWQGNIRQLRNIVRTSIILGSGTTLSLADISWLSDQMQPLSQYDLRTNSLTTPETDFIQSTTNNGFGKMPLEHIEQKAIIETLRQNSGNQKKSAEILGISDRTLRDKIKKYKKQGSLQPI